MVCQSALADMRAAQSSFHNAVGSSLRDYRLRAVGVKNTCLVQDSDYRAYRRRWPAAVHGRVTDPDHTWK